MFVVDTSKLKDKKCVLYDDLGTWPNSGFSGSGFTIENGKLIDSCSATTILKKLFGLKMVINSF